MKKQIKNLFESAIVEPEIKINPKASLSAKEEAVINAFKDFMKAKGIEENEFSVELVDDLYIYFTLNAPQSYIFQIQYHYDPERGMVQDFQEFPLKKKEIAPEEIDEVEAEEEEIAEEVAEEIKEGKILKASEKLIKLAEKKLNRYLTKKAYPLNEKKFSPEVKKIAKKAIKKAIKK